MDSEWLHSEKLLKSKAFIAIPCADGSMDLETIRGLLGFQGLCHSLGIKNDFCFTSNEALITRARNRLVSYFMASDCTHLFFIDADVGFDGENILKLISRDKDLIVGSYPKKTIPSTYPSSFLRGGDGKFIRDKTHKSLVAVDHSGTGFFCLKRVVIEKMMESYPELKWDNAFRPAAITENLPANVEEIEKYCYTFFDVLLESGLYHGEDNTFCLRWKRIGGEIWCDTDVHLVHVGRMIYNAGESGLKNLLNNNEK